MQSSRFGRVCIKHALTILSLGQNTMMRCEYPETMMLSLVRNHLIIVHKNTTTKNVTVRERERVIIKHETNII